MSSKMTIEQFSEEVDQNKDGQLSHYELISFFQKLFRQKGLTFRVEEMERFLLLSDSSSDGSLSVKEIRDILYAYEKLLLTPKVYPEEFLENILTQLKLLIEEFYFRLKISFESKEEQKGFISLEEFKKILQEYRLFKEEELEAICNPICIPFLKFLRVNYKSFLKLEEFYKAEFEIINCRQSKTLSSKAQKIFQLMKKVGKKYSYDNFLLFSMFDKKKKGFLDAGDIIQVF